MTQLLNVPAASPVLAREDGAVERLSGDVRRTQTIDSYDRSCVQHAERLSHADLRVYLRRLRDRLRTGAIVLDGGCGGGRDLKWMSEHGLTTIGLDLSAGMLTQARRAAPSAALLHGDLRDIPLPNDAVDGVWLCACLLHLSPEEAIAALRETHRVLAPGGCVFVSTASGQGSEWRATELGRRWFQLYSEDDLASLMCAAGLVVVDSATEPGVVLGSWVNMTAEKPS